MTPSRGFFFGSLWLGLALLGLPARGAEGATPVSKMDRDGDGRISREEFVGDPALFEKLDHNHDGFIDGQELKGPGGTAEKAKREPRTEVKVPDSIVAERDIVYKEVGGEKLALDLYRVKGHTYNRAPLAIWIHGGGYVKGSKAGAIEGNAAVFVPLLEKHGYLVASVDYRLCTLDGSKVIDCTIDCKDAVRFLVKNAARYGIDPARVVTLGASAGGGLSLMMALTGDGDFPGDSKLAGTPARVRAAVSYFGVTDFNQSSDEFAQGSEKFPIVFAPNALSDKQQLALVSPVPYMLKREDKIPLLLVHGEKDPVVPFSQSVWLEAEAKRVGYPVEFVRVKNMRHGFQPASGGPITPSLDELWKTTVAFVLKTNG